MSRLVIVANRLPITVRNQDGRAVVSPSTGGLATGLRAPHQDGDGLWFGWPGDLANLPDEARQQVLADLQAARLVPMELTAEEVEGYYNAFSNGVLWPVCHYLIDRVPLQTPDWEIYRRVNQRFADAIVARWQPGDVIWVHDFHLMLLPALLRERLPEARIGFFLHIPFPSSEVFRVLPWRLELLRGLLGADLIGFHTLAYLRHFAASLLRLLGLEVEIDRLSHGGRDVRLMALPMGIDVAHFERLAGEPEVQIEAAATRERKGQTRLVLGIDRLDYTKGIPRRLLAFERLLELRRPEDPTVQLVQIAATSRDDVEEYRAFKRSVDEIVGRINGRFGTADFTPIRYVNTGLDSRGVTALYLAADVMLVTPLRDGLNLVAKEFIASRTDGDGVLVLSELAGVASELPEALLVNPYDLDSVATTIARGLAMPVEERQRRMTALREAVTQHTVHDWVRTFLDELQAAPTAPQEVLRDDFTEIARAAHDARTAGPLCVLLDYDGTLVEFANRPEQALPDPSLLQLLERLSSENGIEVHIVSGRPRSFLERHFARLRVGLHAEHGGSWRMPGQTTWTNAAQGIGAWRERAGPLLERVARHVPGSHVENKEQSVAWHFRRVDPAFASVVVKELRLHLLELLSNVAATIVEGNRVLEIRPQGVHKGQAVARALEAGPANATAIVLGDDRTDEDMFAAAPAQALTVHVGPTPSVARYRIADVNAARALLRTLLP